VRTAECVASGCHVVKWHRVDRYSEAGVCLRCETAVFRPLHDAAFDRLVKTLVEWK